MNRADFIPDIIWVNGEGSWMVPLHRADDPERWLAEVNSNKAVVTQIDDGTDKYGVGRGIFPSSSSSAPGVMMDMLDMLDVREGMDILEIGTGTGYNAALISELSKTGSVTSVEIDSAIAEHARTVLRKVCAAVTVITGDGVLGYPENAPYDRLIATASARAVPFAWVEQTRPGGRIVLPFVGSFEKGAFLSLTVEEGATAHGRFQSTAAFMRLRSHRDGPALWWKHENNREISFTHVRPREVFDEYDAGFALGLLCPGMMAGPSTDPDSGIDFLRLSHAESGSWASFADDPEDEGYEVLQCGPRRLWEELEKAYLWWVDAGRPECTRFGMTVNAKGYEIWLDSPARVVEIS